MTNLWPSLVTLPVSWGEVVDKYTILQLKLDKIADETKLKNVKTEMKLISDVIGDWSRFPSALTSLIDRLYNINAQLWDIENGKRQCERDQCFAEEFIQLARSVYIKNDERAAVKRQINILLNSVVVEEKSHSLTA